MNNSSRTPKSPSGESHIIYLRRSVENETSGASLEFQEERCREFLDRRCGRGNYQVTVFSDEGLSGSLPMRPTPTQKNCRPNLQAIANLIATGLYDGLVVYNQSRLFRSLRFINEYIDDVLLHHDTALLSAADHQMDIFTDEGRHAINMRAMNDEGYRHAVVKRNTDESLMARQQGYYTGQVPFGWDWKPKDGAKQGRSREIVPIPQQQELIRWMKNQYLAGWTTLKIADDLNRHEIAPPSHQPRWDKKREAAPTSLWACETISRLLKCPTHPGLIAEPPAKKKKKANPVEIHAEDYATEEEFQRWQGFAERGWRRGLHFGERLWEPEESMELVDTMAKRVKNFRKNGQRGKAPDLLSDVLVCARCNRKLYIYSGGARGYDTYRCTNGASRGQAICPGLCIRADLVESALLGTLAECAKQPAMLQILHRAADELLSDHSDTLATRCSEIKAALAKIESQTQRLVAALAGSSLTPQQFDIFNKKQLTEKADLEEQLRGAQGARNQSQDAAARARRVYELLTQVEVIWPQLDAYEKRTVLSCLVEKLSADREDRLIRLSIKVALLPEREVVIPLRHSPGKLRPKKRDPLAALSRGEMAILHLHREGHSRPVIAEILGIKRNSIDAGLSRIRGKFDRKPLAEIAELARKRLDEVLPFLPLGTKRQPQCEAAGGGTVDGVAVPFLSGVLMEVFPLLASGATAEEIAQRLQLSPATVRARRARILSLTGTTSTLQAIEMVRQWGLLPK